jgi:hypothetical protein
MHIVSQLQNIVRAVAATIENAAGFIGEGQLNEV